MHNVHYKKGKSIQFSRHLTVILPLMRLICCNPPLTETDLRLPKKRSANGQKCFSFRGAKIWNSLPAESKTASSLNSFKKLIKG